jgi:low temperature requirement protein LtrA
MNLLLNRRIHKSKGERHVTWLELFFDLVAVVAICSYAPWLTGRRGGKVATGVLFLQPLICSR